MPRLFTAVEIPGDIAFALSLLRGGLPGARWIEPESYHLTLRFIGDVDGRTADEVASALSRVARPPLTIAAAGLAAFGAGKPHAVVARVALSSALDELHGEHERIMQRLGLPPERRRFTPHVTLARLRNVSAHVVADYLAMRAGFKTEPVRIDRFVLMSSRASKGGGPYLIEHAYPLAA